MLSFFSVTNFLKTTRPIALISLLVFAYKSKISEAHGQDCLNCEHQPNVCKFLLVLEAHSRHCFSSGAEKCGSKMFSILSILGFSLHSTPSPHHHFIIHPVLFIACLIDVKSVTSSDYSSRIYCITHLPIVSSTYLCGSCTVQYELPIYPSK
jgi:hypothetical protein